MNGRVMPLNNCNTSVKRCICKLACNHFGGCYLSIKKNVDILCTVHYYSIVQLSVACIYNAMKLYLTIDLLSDHTRQ